MSGVSVGKVKIKNAHIVSLFLFQYSLTMLLTSYISPINIIVITSFLLIIVSTFINGLKLKCHKCVACFFIIMLILFAKCLQGDGENLYPIIVYSAVAGPILIIIGNGFSYKEFLDYSYKLAYINFFFIALYPFVDSYEYMRFGYGMLLTVLFLYIKILFSKNRYKTIDILLFFCALIMMIIYGSRGAVFSFILFGLIDMFFIRKKMVNNVIVLAIGGFILFHLSALLTVLNIMADKMGVPSYFLWKMHVLLSDGMKEASSHRFDIYTNGLTRISDNIIFGAPMEIHEHSGHYVHNLFLQAGLDFGLLGIVIMALLVMVILYQIFKSAKDGFRCYALAVLFSIAIGRLMFSSYIWRRPEFWMMLFV